MGDVGVYRLSLGTELENFRPEIEYACDFVDQCHGLRRDEDATTVLHYQTRPESSLLPDGAHVPSAVFLNCVRIEVDGLHLDRKRLLEIESSILPRPTAPGTRYLGYDAIGLIFFMLSRIEERDCGKLDRYGRFPATEAWAVRKGRHLDPLADQAAADIAAAITGNPKPVSRTLFSVRLTHDVDRLRSYHRPTDWFRPALGDLFRRRDPRSALRRCRNSLSKAEPWRSLRQLMEIDEGYGQVGHYYFMGPTHHAMDSPYAVTMQKLLREVTDELRDRNHTIGFHPGFETYTDVDEWVRQRDGLETIVGYRVREGRQHVLRYRAEITPDIWDRAGMSYDCSLAYPECVGFRPGTCRSYRAYSLVHRRKLKLWQGATAICDFGLMGGKYQDLSVEEALSESDKAILACKRYGGELVVLFHTGLADKPWIDFYRRLLARIF